MTMHEHESERCRPKRFTARTMVELNGKIYKHHGWSRVGGESMSERISALYAVKVDYGMERYIATPKKAAAAARPGSYQSRVQAWMLECFSPVIAADKRERNHRFLEEALELVQACGCTASEALQLVGYTFGRPVGEPTQEVGGVMVTLAALCEANGMDMREAGEKELARILVPATIRKIRAKQAGKPKHSPLPQTTPNLGEQLREARAEAEKYRSLAEEYNLWIQAHAAGGNYDEFVAQMIAARELKGQT